MRSAPLDLGRAREVAIEAAEAAGALLRSGEQEPLGIRPKGSAGDVVTDLDLAAEKLILERLRSCYPEHQIIAEESGVLGAEGACVWLVDPLDGTKEFINRNGEFTVNIALIENGYPTLGVVLAPALSWLFAGARGIGAFLEENAQRRPIACRATPAAGLTVVASRSHGDAEALEKFLAGRNVASQRNAGSSLKLCLIAAGECDVYPRLGRTMEWDIAAGDAVLRAAGGMVTTLAGEPLVYGKPDFTNPHFAAWGLVQAAASTGAP